MFSVSLTFVYPIGSSTAKQKICACICVLFIKSKRKKLVGYGRLLLLVYCDLHSPGLVLIVQLMSLYFYFVTLDGGIPKAGPQHHHQVLIQLIGVSYTNVIFSFGPTLKNPINYIKCLKIIFVCSYLNFLKFSSPLYLWFLNNQFFHIIIYMGVFNNISSAIHTIQHEKCGI